MFLEGTYVAEIIQKDVHALALDAVVFDNNARASDNLSWVALTIDLAQASPSTEDLGVSDLDQVDLVLSTKSFDELDVLCLGASLNQDAKMGLTSIESLCAFTKTTSKTVVNEGVFKDFLKGILYGHFTLGCLCDFYLLNGGVDLNFISSVRHL